MQLDFSNALTTDTCGEKLLCPVCGTVSQRTFEKYGYWIQSCQHCGHQFVADQPSKIHVQQVYGDDYFQGGGAGYPDYLAEGSLVYDHGAYYAKLLQRYLQPGRLLDVGAAAGFILRAFVDRGWQGEGVEPNATMVAHGRRQLGLEMTCGSLEQWRSARPTQDLSQGKSEESLFDLVTMIQVLPHFYDLHEALATAAEVTKLGGFWLIETWNRDSFTTKLCGQHWHEYSPPSVLHWFSPRDLRLLAARYGFQPVASGRPPKWIKGSHIKSLLRYKLKDLPGGHWLAGLLHLIPDGMKFPYPAEDLVWVLYQKAH